VAYIRWLQPLLWIAKPGGEKTTFVFSVPGPLDAHCSKKTESLEKTLIFKQNPTTVNERQQRHWDLQ
jgi:hypothetical protein